MTNKIQETMKKTMYKTLLLLAAALPAACTTDLESLAETAPEAEGTPFVVTATMPTDEADTRVVFTEDKTSGSEKLEITWAESGEKIAVNQGGTTSTWSEFTQEGSADASGSVQFNKDDFTPTAGTTYYANYPADFTDTPNDGYSLTASGKIGSAYDNSLLYMYAKATYTEGSPLNFAFKHLASVMRIDVNVNAALVDEITGFAVTASEGLVTGVTADVTGTSVAYSSHACATTGITGTTNVAVTSADATLSLYLRVLPCASDQPMRGLTITLTGTKSGTDVTLTAPVTSSDLTIAAGQWYYTTSPRVATLVPHIATGGTLTEAQIAAAVTSDGTLTLTGAPNEEDFATIKAWSKKDGTTDITKIDLSGTKLTTMPKGLGTTILVNLNNVLTSLEEVVLPTTMTTIERIAFMGCTSLTTINLGNVTSIGMGAFRFCTALTTIDLPKAISIGDEAFFACELLETVTTGATELGAEIFEGCDKLTSITLTATVFTSVSTDVFRYYTPPTNATLKLAAGQQVTNDGSTYTWTPVTGTDIDISGFTNIIVNGVAVKGSIP